ncbi:hypothetical protein VPH35_094396 [Triticum aestivum]
MESPPHKRNVGRDEDRISALTDDLLVGILERIDLREAVRAGALSMRVWIQPEHPKQLTAIFRNLTSVFLLGIFNECDLSWTLFFLEAAPALHNIALSRHSCIMTLENSAKKTNVVWKPSKDLKHLNLKVLLIFGCEDEDKDCNATDLERSKLGKASKVGEASRRRIMERLTHGSSSSVEIIIF